MVIKHLVDRYLIYYVYTPSKINSSFHFTAITFVQFSLFCLLLEMAFFLQIRKQTDPSILTGSAIFIFTLFLLYRYCKNSCGDNEENIEI